MAVPALDFQRPDAGGVVYGGVLMACDQPSIFPSTDQVLDVNLDLVTRNLFLVAGGLDLAEPCSSSEPIQDTAIEDRGYAGSGDLDVMVAGQLPSNSYWPQVVGLAEVNQLLDDLGRCSVHGGGIEIELF